MTIVKIEKHQRGRRPILVYETEINTNKAYEVGFACGIIVGYLEMLGHAAGGWHIVTKPHYENSKQFMRGYQIGWTWARTYHVHHRAYEHSHSKESDLKNIVEHYVRQVGPHLPPLVDNRVPINSDLHQRLDAANAQLNRYAAHLDALHGQHREREQFFQAEMAKIHNEHNRVEDDIKQQLSAKAREFNLTTEQIAQLKAGTVIAMLGDKLEEARRERDRAQMEATDALHKIGRQPRGDGGAGAALREQLAAAMGRVHVKDELIAKLEREKDELNIKLGETEARFDSVETKRVVNQAALDRSRAEEEHCRRLLAKAEEDAKSYAKREEECATELDGLKQQLAVLTQQFQASSKSKEEEIAKLRSEIATLASSDGRAIALEARINELTRELQQANEERKSKGKAVEEPTGADLVHMDVEDESLSRRMQSLTTIDNLRADIQMKTNELTALQSAFTAAKDAERQALFALTQQHAQILAIANSKHSAQVIDLEKQLSIILDENRDIKSKLDMADAASETKLQQLETERQRLLIEVAAGKTLMSTAQTKASDTAAQVEAKSKEIVLLKQSVDEANKQLVAVEESMKSMVPRKDLELMQNLKAKAEAETRDIQERMNRFLTQMNQAGSNFDNLTLLNDELRSSLTHAQAEIEELRKQNAYLEANELQRAPELEVKTRRIQELEQSVREVAALQQQVLTLMEAKTNDQEQIQMLRIEKKNLAERVEIVTEEAIRHITAKDLTLDEQTNKLAQQYQSQVKVYHDKEAELKQQIVKLNQALAEANRVAEEKEELARSQQQFVSQPQMEPVIASQPKQAPVQTGPAVPSAPPPSSEPRLVSMPAQVPVEQPRFYRVDYDMITSRLSGIAERDTGQLGNAAIKLASRLPPAFKFPNIITKVQTSNLDDARYIAAVGALVDAAAPESTEPPPHDEPQFVNTIEDLGPEETPIPSQGKLKSAVHGIAQEYFRQHIAGDPQALVSALRQVVEADKEDQANQFLMDELRDLTKKHPTLVNPEDANIIQRPDQSPVDALQALTERLAILGTKPEHIVEAKERLARLQSGLQELGKEGEALVESHPVPEQVVRGEPLPAQASMPLGPETPAAIEAPPPKQPSEKRRMGIKKTTQQPRGRKQTSSELVPIAPPKEDIQAVLQDVAEAAKKVPVEQRAARAKSPVKKQQIQRREERIQERRNVPTEEFMEDEEEDEPLRLLPKHEGNPLSEMEQDFLRGSNPTGGAIGDQDGLSPIEIIQRNAIKGPRGDTLLNALQSFITGAPLPPLNPVSTNYEQRFQALRSVPLIISYNGRILTTYYRLNPDAPQPKIVKDVNVARYFNPKTATATLSGNTASEGQTITRDVSKEPPRLPPPKPIPPVVVQEPGEWFDAEMEPDDEQRLVNAIASNAYTSS